MTLTNETPTIPVMEEIIAPLSPWPKKGNKTVYPTPMVLERVTDVLRGHPNSRYDSVQLAQLLNVPRAVITRALRDVFERWSIDERSWFLWRATDGITAKYWYDDSRQRTERPEQLRAPRGDKGKTKGARKVKVAASDKAPSLKVTKVARDGTIYAKLIHTKLDGTLVFVDQTDRLIEGRYV